MKSPSEVTAAVSLLGQLSVLNLRNNALLGLPAAIGSCGALAVLDLRGNLIQHIPASVAQLPNLRCEQTFLNILTREHNRMTKLFSLPRSIWLSENQSRPLPSLQVEVDVAGEEVLTCCLLPQLSEQTTCHLPRGEDTCGHATMTRLINIKFDQVWLLILMLIKYSSGTFLFPNETNKLPVLKIYL